MRILNVPSSPVPAILLFLLPLLLAVTATGGERVASPPAVSDADTLDSSGEIPAADAFNPRAARRPKQGEWLEYRLAVPVDPLENSLGPDPLPFPGTETPPSADANSLAAFSAFDLPILWRGFPLRLEILQVDESSCRARMTFSGDVSEVVLPLFASSSSSSSAAAAADIFRYPPPQPLERRIAQRIGERDYEAELTIRRGRRYGFARLAHQDIPFGLLRFATENLDLVLVGMGEGTPPPYPLPDAGGIVPPLGRLYAADEATP